MECFKPICIALTPEARAKRIAAEYMPLEWRFATHVNVPCGKCPSCLSRRRSEWMFRLLQEVQSCKSCYFITLTYDEENVPKSYCDGVINNCVSKDDVQKFLKRLRKAIQPFKIRYFLVSEYGPKTYRPHYHMLLFDFPHELKNKIDEYVNESWKLGFIRVDPVTFGRVAYVTSYCLDSSTLPKGFVKNFMLCSRRPAIGSAYLDNERLVDYHLRNMDDFGYIPTSGEALKTKLPRYYSDRIFSEEQRNHINLKSSEFYSKKESDLLNRHASWLRRHGYHVDDVTLYTPFPSSPLDIELQKRTEFSNAVKRKCKMKTDL